MSEEKLWISEGTIITAAYDAKEAEEKMHKGIVIVDDVYEVKPFDFTHLKEENRERATQRTIMELKETERRLR